MFCNVCRADRPSVCEPCVNEMRANHKELADAMAADACLPVRTSLQEAVLRAAVAMTAAADTAEGVGIRQMADVCRAVHALLAAEPAWGEGADDEDR